jgi:uncharacterized phage-associated protein
MSVYSDLRNEYQKRCIDNVNKSDAEKSKLILKMLLFNKLIEELVKWKKEKNRQTEQEVLKDLSFVPLMKCLYIVCLLTVEENSEKSLFDLFDKFVAYPKGPVDEDCYFFMDQLPDYTIWNNDGVEELNRKPSNNMNLSSRIDFINREISNKNKMEVVSGIEEIDKSLLINEYEQYNEILDKAIGILKNASFFPGFREKERLIDLTHMKVWEDAYFQQGSHIMDTSTDNKKRLLDEAMFLKWNIAA